MDTMTLKHFGGKISQRLADGPILIQGTIPGQIEIFLRDLIDVFVCICDRDFLHVMLRCTATPAWSFDWV